MRYSSRRESNSFAEIWRALDVINWIMSSIFPSSAKNCLQRQLVQTSGFPTKSVHSLHKFMLLDPFAAFLSSSTSINKSRHVLAIRNSLIHHRWWFCFALDYSLVTLNSSMTFSQVKTGKQENICWLGSGVDLSLGKNSWLYEVKVDAKSLGGLKRSWLHVWTSDIRHENFHFQPKNNYKEKILEWNYWMEKNNNNWMPKLN